MMPRYITGEAAGPLSALELAVLGRCWQEIPRLLRGMDSGRMVRDPALVPKLHALYQQAIENEIPAEIFEALLDCFAPLGPLDHAERYAGASREFAALEWVDSLAALAASYDRCDLLDALLLRGADPGPRGGKAGCALEAAIEGGSYACTERLLAEPSLPLAPTPRILAVWKQFIPFEQDCLLYTPDNIFSSKETERRFEQHAANQKKCLLLYAQKLPREALFPQRGPEEMPVPRALGMADAVHMQDLDHDHKRFYYLCTQGEEPTRKQARQMLEWMALRPISLEAEPDKAQKAPGGARSDLPEEALAPSLRALLQILRVHPALIKNESAQALVLRYYLAQLPHKCGNWLDPWLEELKRYYLPVTAVCNNGLFAMGELLRSPEWNSGFDLGTALERWERLLPDGPAPWLDANEEFVLPEKREAAAGVLERALARCLILREKRGEKPVSWLARQLLERGTSRLVQQLGPGGLLDGEEREALLEYCIRADTRSLPAENRMAVITGLEREPDYEL